MGHLRLSGGRYSYVMNTLFKTDDVGTGVNNGKYERLAGLFWWSAHGFFQSGNHFVSINRVKSQ